jgi:hypothetical protein
VVRPGLRCARPKSNAEVRSPLTVRRQVLMLGSRTPIQVAMNRVIEVWSKVWEHTYPPTVHGEITSIGTRMPSPIGWPSKCSSACSGPGSGGGTWSKYPSFSS